MAVPEADGADGWENAAELRAAFTRFLLSYRCGIDEMMTKIRVLTREFQHIHRHNPIEHVDSRLKTPASIIEKARRRGYPMTLESIRTNMTDIAGIRITCGFISDTYRLRDMLLRQDDVTVLTIKDYIAHPKPNGYSSLHLIVEVPVFLSDRAESVRVEVQIRTIAMDFWASLEHKIYYKYDKAVPPSLLAELKDAADAAHRLDLTMEHLHDAVIALGAEDAPAPGSPAPGPAAALDVLGEVARRPLPEQLIAAILDTDGSSP